MSLLKEIKEQLKLKAVGVNLSNKRQDAIAAFIDAKISTVEEIEAALDTYAEYRPFAEIAKEDDRERLAETKAAQEKEAKRIADLAAGKTPEPEGETPQEKMLRQALEGIQALTGEIAAIKGEKVTNVRQTELDKLIEGTSPSFRKAKAAYLRDVTMTDEAYQAWLEDAKTEASENIQEISNAGLGGDRIQGGTGSVGKQEKVSPAVAAFIAKTTEARKTAGHAESV